MLKIADDVAVFCENIEELTLLVHVLNKKGVKRADGEPFKVIDDEAFKDQCCIWPSKGRYGSKESASNSKNNLNLISFTSFANLHDVEYKVEEELVKFVLSSYRSGHSLIVGNYERYPARMLCTDKKSNDFNVVVLVTIGEEEFIMEYNENGCSKYHSSFDNGLYTIVRKIILNENS